MRFRFSLATALFTAGTLITGATMAQTTATKTVAVPVGKAAAAPLLPNGQKVTEPVVRLKVRTLPPFLKFIPIQADMTGWTPISGVSKGGASIATTKGDNYLFVRGGDDDIYAVKFDPANIGPIPASAWSALNVKSTSEPECRIAASGKEGICAFLGDKGNAEYQLMAVDDGQVRYSYYGVHDMGGSNAGAAPTFLETPVSGTDNKVYGLHLRFGVWDGKQTLFVREDGYKIGLGGTGPWNADAQWEKMSGTVSGPVGCADDTCAFISGGVIQLVITYHDLTAPMTFGKSPALPVAPQGKPAVVLMPAGKSAVVVRGADGHVYEAFFDRGHGTFNGGWHDEKGYIAAGSSPTCTAVNTQPVCVIQGSDGRLYAKMLATAGAI